MDTFNQWWGWLVGALVLIVLVWIAVWITSGNRRFHRNYNDAMRLLSDKRMKGEINEEEYKKLMDELKGKTST